MIIKVILITIIALLLIRLLSARNTSRTQASKKILLILLILAAILSVLWPEITNWAARKVDVGRGADLLLYLLAVAFFFQVINNYIKAHEDRRNLVKIVRRQSIIQAQINSLLKK